MIGKFAHLMKAWHERAVCGAFDAALIAQNERRHEQKHRAKAAKNALGEHEAHVPADPEAHEREREKADDGGSTRGADGGNRGAQSVRHGLFGFHAALFFAGKGVQQENGVVH